MFLLFLSVIGGIVLLFVTVVVIQLIIAFTSSCDVATARTSEVPTDGFRNQTIWITGASSGLGKCMAIQLAKRRTNLILSSRRIDVLEKVANECRDVGATNVRILPLDLNDSVGVLQEKANDVAGHVNVLINNGGVSTRVLAKESSIDVDEYVCQVDYMAHVALTKACLAPSRPPSRIINIGSAAGKVGVPVRTAYCGAKHALFGFMDALRIECTLDGTDTHILNVCLGSTRTDVARNAVVGTTTGTTTNRVQMEVRGESDDNIENGLDPNFVVERILAVSYAGTLPECWLAVPRELLILYIAQYVPRTGMKMLTKAFSKQYAIQKKEK